MINFRWALVDIETTGLSIRHDEIIEVSVLIITENGIENTWHTLIKPSRRIPLMIEHLTGITNEAVVKAAKFEDIAIEFHTFIKGCVFVAHNARFDYGFIKNHLKTFNISWTPPVLCTLKLFKILYPGLRSYALKELALQAGLPIDDLHRATHDTFLLYQLLKKAESDFGLTILLEKARTCYRKSSIPSKLITDLSTIPESPGVYLFYGSNNDLPLYIGKSITLRQRIISHFQADYTNSKDFALAQQVVRVSYIPTAGELSALLLESELIKKHMPLYNQRLRRNKSIVGFKATESNGYLNIKIVRQLENNECNLLFGAYRSVTAAKKHLLNLVKEFNLCPKLCHLEHTKTTCFSYQLKRCQGACIQEETSSSYNNPGLGSNGTANRLKDYIGLLISIIRYVSFYRIVNCEVVQVFSLNTDR